MIYRKFSPCEALVPYVECYFAWQTTDALKQELMVESPPNGYCSIVFNSGDPYYLQNKKYERLAVPQQFVAGQSIYSYRLFLQGVISIAGIVFKPAALATLYNLPIFEYTEERIDLSNIFKKEIVTELAEKIKTEQEITQKVRILEQFVLDGLAHRKNEPDYIDYAANLIVETNGLLNVNDLLENVYMSRRNFERKFFKKVGLSPKYYARIRRMSHLMTMVAGRSKVDWGAVFSECEFYDQSHFIKDFIEFTGRSPQQYLEENAELVHLVPKPKPESL